MGIFYTKNRRGGNEELNKFAMPQAAPRDRTAPPLHSAQAIAPFRQPSFITPQN
jgi:hypothetical protein